MVNEVRKRLPILKGTNRKKLLKVTRKFDFVLFRIDNEYIGDTRLLIYTGDPLVTRR